VLLAGCSGQPAPSDEAGFGLPRHPVHTALPDSLRDLTGTLRVEPNGCFTLDLDEGDRRWVIWPRGAAQEGGRVILPDGDDVGDGDRLASVGAVTDAVDLPEWSVADGYLRSVGTFCDADRRGVVIVDRVRHDR
jgi:hypothetical protein